MVVMETFHLIKLVCILLNITNFFHMKHARKILISDGPNDLNWVLGSEMQMNT